ncbi:hypothetical protein [Nostoc sp. FACHB-190]|uniref:hypothetical protein n=1 Tax=Nostoc sp. FACHB-190 TaxID=2692838 RepID=UPI0016834494|nr:hypothetical protein [Nostoc sp. FACHB-190]MBD2298601.1 hypothetical protein [Nostoc sp. FACHB-190]
MSEQEEFNIQEFQDKVLKAVDVILYSENLPPDIPVAFATNGDEKSKQEIEEALKKKDVKKIICPVLKSITNEASNIANAITPVLVGAVLAGTLVIPLNPIFFGWLAVVIAKGGIAAICADYDS